MRQSDLELDGVISRRTALAGLVVFAIIAASTLVLFLVRSDAATEVRGEPGTTWISGEARGRVVLAAAGGDRPSVAVELGADESAFDVVDLGGVVLVQDRETGEVTVLNGGSGVVATTFTAAVPTDDRAAIVPAGQIAFAVDPVAETATEISADGAPGEPTPVGPFTDWVGTADGRLWLLDRNDGSYGIVAAGAVDRQRLAEPGADLVLSAVGGDPVVLDRDNSRLRWLRRDETIELENGSTAILQDPDTSGSCVHVLTVTEIACYGPGGALRSADVETTPEVIAGAHVFGNRYNAVVTWPTQTTVYGVDWRTNSVTTFERTAPSERSTVGWSTSGPLLIDDPGSRYAFSLDRGRLTDFDKFSRRSVVLGPDGATIDGGVGALDEEAETSGEIQGPTDTPPPVTQNDDGRNDPPDAVDDAAVTRYGRDVTINVLANDIDPDGDVLLVTSVGQPTGAGEVEVIDGSKVIFSPDDISSDERTTVTFEYTIADPSNLEDSATVTVEIRPEGDNEAPVTVDDRANTLINTPIDIAVLANDTDGDGDPLTISELTEPQNGSAAPTGTGDIRYEPDLGFTGTDVFEYTVIDGFGGEATAEVKVRVDPNLGDRLPPDAVDDRASAVQGQRVRIPVLENDTDPDGSALTVVAAGPLEGLDISIVDGQFIDVTPGRTVAGLNSFKYTIEDSDGLRDTATVALVVGESELDQPPRAVDDRVTSASISIPVNVLANDVDPDGDPLAIIAWTQPDQGGSVNRASPSTLRFTPTPTFRGTATFSYTISDPLNNTSTAKVIVQVIDPIGSGPVARDDTVSTFVNEKAVIPALANDSHPDGLPFSYAGPPTVRDGSATVNPDNTITYTPPPGITGTYTLSYTIQDTFARKSSATVTVSVVQKPTVNRPPVTVDDLTATQFQTPVLIDVLANDSDPDGQQLTIGSVGSPPAGRGDTAIVSNQIRYTPSAGFSGLASFSYTASDGIASTSGTVLVQVTERIKVPPIAVADLMPPLLTNGTAVAAPLLNDSDPDGPNNLLTIKSVGVVPGLAVSVRADGVTLRITASSQTGTFVIPYTIVDSDGLQASSTIEVKVDVPPNVAPIAVDDFVTTPSVSTPIAVMANDVDPDGGTLSLVSVTQPAAGGTATIVGSGIVFKPATGFTGIATFTYSIRDPQLATATATVAVTVTACAQPVPALSPDIAAVPLNGAVTIPILANDAQPSGHLELGAASSGSASIIAGAPAQVQYTAAPGFSGPATFSYTVSNDCDIRATATVSVDVNPAPTALNDLGATLKNTPTSINVTANDVDLFNDPLIVGSIASVIGGTATAVGGVVTFTPSLDFTGNASFTYTAVDPGGRSSNPATVVIAVSNRAPVVQNEQGTMLTTDGSFTHPDVLANDSDPDGDPITLGPSPTVVPAVGTASVSGRSITFTPSGTLTPGPIEIHYTVLDNLGASSPGVLTIVVLNRDPTANDDFGSGQQPINVIDNDSDPDPGQTIGVTGVGVESAVSNDPLIPATGTASQAGPNQVRFNPDDPAFTGTVVLLYTISDGFGGTASGRVTITFP